jgi:hypothetical protein
VIGTLPEFVLEIAPRDGDALIPEQPPSASFATPRSSVSIGSTWVPTGWL